jgi:hypothetical protein
VTKFDSRFRFTRPKRSAPLRISGARAEAAANHPYELEDREEDSCCGCCPSGPRPQEGAFGSAHRSFGVPQLQGCPQCHELPALVDGYGLQRPPSVVIAVPQASRFNRIVKAAPVPLSKRRRNDQIDLPPLSIFWGVAQRVLPAATPVTDDPGAICHDRFFLRLGGHSASLCRRSAPTQEGRRARTLQLERMSPARTCTLHAEGKCPERDAVMFPCATRSSGPPCRRIICLARFQ